MKTTIIITRWEKRMIIMHTRDTWRPKRKSYMKFKKV